MHTSNPVILIVWLCFLAVGCFGAPYGYYNNVRYWGYGGGLALFIQNSSYGRGDPGIHSGEEAQIVAARMHPNGPKP